MQKTSTVWGWFVSSLNALLFLASSAAADDDRVDVVLESRVNRVLYPDGLTSLVVELAESCSVNTTSEVDARPLWDVYIHSGSFLHVVFSEPRRFRLVGSDNRTRVLLDVQEALLPLPSDRLPEHVLVKWHRKVRSFSKYDPLVLAKVVESPEVGLASMEPYRSIVAGDEAPVEQHE